MKNTLILLLLIYGMVNLSMSQVDSTKYMSVVSATKMNVVYLGVPNPFDIMATGVSFEKMKVTISQGTITYDSPYHYTIFPESTGILSLEINAEINGESKVVGRHQFRVKRIPDPIATIAGMTGGIILKDTLVAQIGIKTIIENFDFDVIFHVTEFSFIYTDSMNNVNSIDVHGAMFTKNITDQILKSQRGETLIFENIKAKGADGEIRSIGRVKFTIY
ncbi:MAG: GldM family protein [Bacteroidota bacterium]